MTDRIIGNAESCVCVIMRTFNCNKFILSWQISQLESLDITKIQKLFYAERRWVEIAVVIQHLRYFVPTNTFKPHSG